MYALREPIEANTMVGGFIMLGTFGLVWLLHWLPHQRELPLWSAEANDAYRWIQWGFWGLWLGLGMLGIVTGLYRALN